MNGFYPCKLNIYIIIYREGDIDSSLLILKFDSSLCHNVALVVVVIIVLSCRGYCAPEYQYHGKMSLKSDIYSLGVIMLELVTGSKEDPDIANVSLTIQNYT